MTPGELLPSAVMADEKAGGWGGAREGAGRKPDGEKPVEVRSFRVGDQHLAELDALVADGWAADRSAAVRKLIDQSAKRRARRAR